MIQETPVIPQPNPWKTIWFHPRVTIKAILEYNLTEEIEPLSMILGAWLALLFLGLLYSNPGNFGEVVTMIFMGTLFGSFGGFFVVRWLASLMAWVGRVMGGVAETKMIYTALTWSSVPAVGAISLQILLLLLTGILNSAPWVAPLLILLKIGILILGVWQTILGIAMVTEIFGVPLWKAFLIFVGPLALSIGTIFLLLFICFFGDAFLMSRNL